VTSPSTLIRQAAKAKSPRIAARLRAEAAKLRREKRKNPIRQADVIAEKIRKIINPVTERAIETAASGGWKVMDQEPEEILGEHTIHRLRVYARQKPKPDGNDHFAIALRSNIVDARIKASKATRAAADEQLRTQREAHNICVVSAFLAEMGALSRHHNGELPAATIVPGYTIVRLIDALRRVGYTENGKEGRLRVSEVDRG
jgi:hypothetical protein